MSGERDWYSPDAFPELRERPPWVMEEMVASEPELLEGIATGADTAAAALVVRGAGPVEVVGCGTSEHAAMGVTAMLAEAGVAAAPRQAFEAALDPRGEGAVLAVSHEGGTWATAEALAAARAAGARTALITARPEGAAARHADAVLTTPAVDRSWCHTVGYTSPLAAGLALTARLGAPPVPAGVVREVVAAGIAARPQAAAAAGALAGCARLLIVGSGADRVSARELALKVEEACYLPAVMRDLETVLHGHLPAEGPETGLVLIACDRRGGERHRLRAQTLLRAAARIGIRCAAISTQRWDGLAAAGELPAPRAAGLPAAAAALLGAAAPLQLLALELAHARNTNPDLIRRDQEPYREAAKIVEGD